MYQFLHGLDQFNTYVAAFVLFDQLEELIARKCVVVVASALSGSVPLCLPLMFFVEHVLLLA